MQKKFCRTTLFSAILFSAFLLYSCHENPESSLSVSAGNEKFALYAVNSSSKSNEIQKAKKRQFLAYKFSDETLCAIQASEKPLSLQISVSKNGLSELNFFFLSESETAYSVGKKFSVPKNSVKTEIEGFATQNDFTCSIMLPKNTPAGFAVSTDNGSLTLNSVQFVSAKIGWSYTGQNPWFAFPENGGIIPATKERTQNSALSFAPNGKEAKSDAKRDAKIYFALSNKKTDYDDGKGYRVQFKSGKQVLNLYPAKELHNEIISTLAFENFPSTMQCILGSQYVDAVIMDVANAALLQKNDANTLPKPIKIDCGLIQNWPKANWRQEDFEIFEWADFPGVLIFDFANYKVQSSFLKRLAFFVEKVGYVGTLASDEDIKNEHGYNAHDYKAQSLADFFETARKENFPLNESERLLERMLLDSGVIVKEGNWENARIRAGKGALISISKESADYLRTSFICHEGMHGVFFVDSDFRKFIDNLYARTDPTSIEFLKAYFTATPSLNYNIKDSYLMKNEFMAYLVQQPLSNTEQYFSEKLATRWYINQKRPDLADYIKETKASGLVEAATELDKYIFERWNFNLGRTWRISIFEDDE